MPRSSLPSVVQSQDPWECGQTLEPRFRKPSASLPIFRAFAKELGSALSSPEQANDRLRAMADRLSADERRWPREDAAALLASTSVLLDLAHQGWQFKVEKSRLRARPPAAHVADPAAEKARIRRQELVKREEQLSEPPTREFIRSMERRRMHGNTLVSVLNLMCDGRELARKIRDAASGSSGSVAEALDGVVQPYLQFVDDKAICEWTGLRLQDVWRYFRHTWTNQYVSVPGRTMFFLVRDAGAPFHPVMGIAALSSPIVQIRERDIWLGWHPSAFLTRARENPTDKIARWLRQTVDSAIAEIHTADLADSVITRAQLRRPTDETISKLVAFGRKEREKHHRLMSSKDYKRADQAARRGPDFWLHQAETHLFKSKRALVLAELLRCDLVLRELLGKRPSAAGLRKLLSDPTGVAVVTRILRKAKADRVGILMADISVCGALPPYGALLGGKLVAMLATSPEVVAAYRRRYSKATSEIASSMKGKAVVRDPSLVFLGTTSLYGSGSSQYNRITIPCDRLGGAAGQLIRYYEQGKSEAFGTSHFSRRTVKALEKLVSQSERGQRVNHVFGEGTSPKMRKIREGLELLGLRADLLLKHGRKRVVYCVPLISNYTDFLVGMDRKPKYLMPLSNARGRSDAIVQWWRERWFRQRAIKPEVLAQVESHNLTYPVVHGARVVLPTINSSQDDFFPSR